MELIDAIARMEGFYAAGSRAQRNNNPGNIVWGEFTQEHGALHIEVTPAGEKARFAVFPDSEVLFTIPG